MGWLLSNLDTIATLLAGGYAVVQKSKAKKARAAAKKAEADLKAIRRMAGTLAPWEEGPG